MTFFITRKCNSACPFCFYLKSGNRPADPPEELSLDEIQKISRSLGPLLWLAFSGGEIFLRDDLAEISRIFYENNTPALMLYPTNGMLPEIIKEQTEQILKECKKSIVVVKLSIDGVREAHDSLRHTPGSFDKTMQTYGLLKGFLRTYPNFELGVNTVFCSENQDTADDIIDFVSSLEGIKTHTISLIRGSLADESYKAVDNRKYRHAIERLDKNLKKKISGIYRFRGARIKAAQDIVQRRLIHQTTTARKRLVPCYAGRLNLVLTENGNVYPCEILRKPFGNVRAYDYDMRRIMRSEKAGDILRDIRDNACYCTHECYFMTNILFNARLYPALIHEYLQL
jgi:MoaA/NifB/PqqE/SkfB family radical SAM enzyme